ncbi:uncharacterized protein METZ01_LOCUS460655, partial [marine metagenome]
VEGVLLKAMLSNNRNNRDFMNMKKGLSRVMKLKSLISQSLPDKRF